MMIIISGCLLHIVNVIKYTQCSACASFTVKARSCMKLHNNSSVLQCVKAEMMIRKPYISVC